MRLGCSEVFLTVLAEVVADREEVDRLAHDFFPRAGALLDRHTRLAPAPREGEREAAEASLDTHASQSVESMLTYHEIAGQA